MIPNQFEIYKTYAKFNSESCKILQYAHEYVYLQYILCLLIYIAKIK